MGADRVRESERARKKGGASAAEEEPPEEAVPCGLCGEPLIEGATGDQEPRGSYHLGCIRKARQVMPGRWDLDAGEYHVVRRRKRRS